MSVAGQVLAAGSAGGAAGRGRGDRPGASGPAGRHRGGPARGNLSVAQTFANAPGTAAALDSRDPDEPCCSPGRRAVRRGGRPWPSSSSSNTWGIRRTRIPIRISSASVFWVPTKVVQAHSP
ncbi:hypothetical protein LV779_08455 [Streptomyces thinghirensis]|nr:hypothetical protein [Streptomyces thinghirensis]